MRGSCGTRGSGRLRRVRFSSTRLEIIMSKFLKLVLALSMVGFIAGCDKSMNGSMSMDKSMSKN